MNERILVFNSYVGNRQEDQLVQWIKGLHPDVSLICETGNAHVALRRAGKIYYNHDEDPPIDPSILVSEGHKVDQHGGGRLTRRVPRSESPNMWKDRWYVRVRINNRVYYSIHANAVIGNRGSGGYANNGGARAWERGMRTLKEKIRNDKARGYAVRVGGDFNFGKGLHGDDLTPQKLFNDLEFDYHVDRVMWLAWDPKYDKLVEKKTLGIAPGADAHHSLLVILESRQDNKPKPQPKKYNRVIVTSNMGSGNGPGQVKEDLDWIKENFKPDLWALQDCAKHTDLLREVEGYAIALPPRAKDFEDRQGPVLYDKSQYRHVGSRNFFQSSPLKKRARRVITSHHFRDRSHGDSVFLLNTHIYADIDAPEAQQPGKAAFEAVKDHLTNYAEMANERADGNSYVFWAGDFNVDEHKDDRVRSHGFPEYIFAQHGLISIYDELKTPKTFDSLGNRLVDAIGSVKEDTRVKAVSVSRSPKRNSNHRFIRAVYSITSEGGGAKDPTDPGSEPDPEPAKTPKSEKDNGTDLDHTDCCGGFAG